MKKKTLALVAAGATVLALGGLGSLFIFGGGGPSVQLTAAEVTKVSPTDVTTEVNATGTISGEREVALSTSLSGPVSAINVRVGDRVEADQVLATIDTSETQRELDNQRATQAADQQTSRNQIESAQLELSQLQGKLDAGLNPEINSARAAVEKARTTFDDAARKRDSAPDSPEVAQARANVQQARDAVRTANNQSLQSGFNALGNTTGGEAEGAALANSIMQWAEQDASVGDAHRRLAEAEDALARQLREVDEKSADQARAAATAYTDLSDAERGLRAAELAAQHQINTQSQAVEHALKGAAAQSVSSDIRNESLRLKLNDSQLRSPFKGIVTTVKATAGQPSQGSLLTITDDSTLRLKVNVKEADISGVSVGDRVTFTTPSNPGKTYTGKVSFISPVNTDQQEGSSSSSSNSQQQGTPKVEFPVEIHVEGERDGLHLGSTARAKIITEEHKGVLSVPLSALIREDDKTYVLVISNGVLEQREVTVGSESVLNAAITSGLEEGDTIVNQPETHRGAVGSEVSVAGAAE